MDTEMIKSVARQYGIVGFNVQLDTLQVISETILQVRASNCWLGNRRVTSATYPHIFAIAASRQRKMRVNLKKTLLKWETTLEINRYYHSSNQNKPVQHYSSKMYHWHAMSDTMLFMFTVTNIKWFNFQNTTKVLRTRQLTRKQSASSTAQRQIQTLCPSLKIRGQLPAPVVNGGDSFSKRLDFQL